MNELVFFLYILIISSSLLISLKISKEALISIICLQAILVNLFVTKEIPIFGLLATASDAIAVGITLGLNLLQEYFGKIEAQKTIWISFFCAIFYSIVSKLHVLYIPANENISVSNCFDIILNSTLRLIMASLIVYIIVQNIDCQLYGYLNKKFKNRYFILRNYGSTFITQFLDTLLFSFLGLYKLNSNFSSINTIVQIIIVSYTIKLIVIFIATPYLALSKKIINISKT